MGDLVFWETKVQTISLLESFWGIQMKSPWLCQEEVNYGTWEEARLRVHSFLHKRMSLNVTRLIGIERTGFQYGKYAKGSKTIVANNYFCYEIWCFLG